METEVQPSKLILSVTTDSWTINFKATNTIMHSLFIEYQFFINCFAFLCELKQNLISLFL